MKKNGFTLIELLAVLAILAILGLLITPTVFSSIEKFKVDSADKQISMLESAAGNWASDKLTLFTKGTYYITIGDLKAEGYLEKNFKDPTTNKNYPNDAYIKIMYTGKTYKVEYVKKSGTLNMESNLDNNGPKIKLNGDSIINVKVGEAFTDPGVIAYNSAGANITSTVTKIIKQNNTTTVSSINNLAIGNYVIYYKVLNNGVTQVVTRNVVVYNPDPPKTLSGTVNVNISNNFTVSYSYVVSKSSTVASIYYAVSNISGPNISGSGNSLSANIYTMDSAVSPAKKSDTAVAYLMPNNGNYVMNGLNGSASGTTQIALNQTSFNSLTTYVQLGSGSYASYPINISWSDSNLK